jgi:nucleotide-binding universal stress UspA family protein
MTEYKKVLLASEGRPFPPAAVEAAAELAGFSVRVLSIARVHGVAFGLPNPGLMPTRDEWQQQRDLVAKAVKALRKRGLAAEGQVIGTRKAAARIIAEATAYGCEAIVMAADPPRNRLVADFFWEQEPYRVRRRAKLPVILVTQERSLDAAPSP